ncbi:MAG: hypothetical protein PHT62_05030 [Desulfotomaculaceae bacterium]|nr:hypothetical protein [Desulfotomaculaceae bacterium]
MDKLGIYFYNGNVALASAKLSYKGMIVMSDLEETIKLNNQRIMEEWIAALHSLMSQVKQWVSSFPHKDSFSAVDLMVNKSEEPVGEYQAPMLILTTDQTPIEVLPVGRFAIGAIGRVDITNHKRSFTLLYSSSKGWLLMDRRKPLTEELFKEIIDELYVEGVTKPELH